jgi:hypothetical protein
MGTVAFSVIHEQEVPTEEEIMQAIADRMRDLERLQHEDLLEAVAIEDTREIEE